MKASLSLILLGLANSVKIDSITVSHVKTHHQSSGYTHGIFSGMVDAVEAEENEKKE